MADTNFKGFISCSFSPEDHAIVEFFKGLLSALNFSATVYDRVKVQNLTMTIEGRRFGGSHSRAKTSSMLSIRLSAICTALEGGD